MKKFLKLSAIVLSIYSFLVISPLAFASTVQLTDVYNCPVGSPNTNSVVFYNINTTYRAGYGGCGNTYQAFFLQAGVDYQALEYDGTQIDNSTGNPIDPFSYDTLNSALGSGLFLNGGNITIASTPVVTSTNSGIFFPKDINGNTTASSLTASLGNATGTTVGSLSPVVAVIGGIILAFIGISFVVGMVKETNDKKTNKKI